MPPELPFFLLLLLHKSLTLSSHLTDWYTEFFGHVSNDGKYDNTSKYWCQTVTRSNNDGIPATEQISSK